MITWRWSAVEKLLAGRKPKLGAEIGVKEGRFISYLLERHPQLTMYAVDPWEPQPGSNEDYLQWDFNRIYESYKTATSRFTDRVIEIREYSETAASKVRDESLDFVFIDAQHDYESVKRDIELWTPKVKSGGLISGHDHDSKFPGVVAAVGEAFDDVILTTNAVWAKWK